jgi:hypothetical protein
MQWQISFPINGLYDVIKDSNSELAVGKTKFHYSGNQCIGSILLDINNENGALEEAAYHINKALAKICFAYNTEASIGQGYYVTDLTSNPINSWMEQNLWIDGLM